MKSKQTLKVGQQYRVIKDCMDNFMNGRVVTVKKILNNNNFNDENNYIFSLKDDKLQLITPKTEPFDLGKDCKCLKCGKRLCTCGNRSYLDRFQIPKKEVKKWKNNRSNLWLELGILMLNCKDRKLKEKLELFRQDLLAKSTPKKKSTEIKEIKLIKKGSDYHNLETKYNVFNEEVIKCDSRNLLIFQEKINEILDFNKQLLISLKERK